MGSPSKKLLRSARQQQQTIKPSAGGPLLAMFPGDCIGHTPINLAQLRNSTATTWSLSVCTLNTFHALSPILMMKTLGFCEVK